MKVITAEGFVKALEASRLLLPVQLERVRSEVGVNGRQDAVPLARALVRRPRVLVLDDATSSVDPTTEAEILRSLAGRLQATTTVIVASSLSVST